MYKIFYQCESIFSDSDYFIMWTSISDLFVILDVRLRTI